MSQYNWVRTIAFINDLDTVYYIRNYCTSRKNTCEGDGEHIELDFEKIIATPDELKISPQHWENTEQLDNWRRNNWGCWDLPSYADKNQVFPYHCGHNHGTVFVMETSEKNPGKIFAELARRNPSVVISVAYAGEDLEKDGVGIYHFKNGKIVKGFGKDHINKCHKGDIYNAIWEENLDDVIYLMEDSRFYQLGEEEMG